MTLTKDAPLRTSALIDSLPIEHRSTAATFATIAELEDFVATPPERRELLKGREPAMAKKKTDVNETRKEILLRTIPKPFLPYAEKLRGLGKLEEFAELGEGEQKKKFEGWNARYGTGAATNGSSAPSDGVSGSADSKKKTPRKKPKVRQQQFAGDGFPEKPPKKVLDARDALVEAKALATAARDRVTLATDLLIDAMHAAEIDRVLLVGDAEFFEISKAEKIAKKKLSKAPKKKTPKKNPKKKKAAK